MGEKINTLLRGKLLNKEFEIGFGLSLIAEADGQINIQFDKSKFEIDKKGYVKYAE